MRIQTRAKAEEDLESGYWFYEKQSPGLGFHFIESLDSDIQSLRLYAGTHRKVHGFFRCLSERFPYGIYYLIDGDIIDVHAVFDDRMRPSRIRRRLS